MSTTIPQLQDKKRRVCSHCRFKKVKCDGGNPCSTCLKDGQICIVWAPLEDQRGTSIRQGTLNTYTMQSCMMHQAIVDIIQKGVIPNVPTEALASPHKLLSALGVIDEKDKAAWEHNLEQPWAQTAFNAATTHPGVLPPHAPRGPNEPGKKTPAAKKAAARKQHKQAVRRQQEPTPPESRENSHSRDHSPGQGFTGAAQDPGWHNVAAVAPAQQQLGYNQPPVGQAYGHTVENTFNSHPSSAGFSTVESTFNSFPSASAFPSAPGPFDGHPYNPGYTSFPPASFSSFSPATGYGQLPAYAAPQQWQHQPAATPAMPAATAPSPVPDFPDVVDLFPELSGNGNNDAEGLLLNGQTINEVLGADGEALGPGEAQFTGPGEGVDQGDYEMAMGLIDFNAER